MLVEAVHNGRMTKRIDVKPNARKNILNRRNSRFTRWITRGEPPKGMCVACGDDMYRGHDCGAY